MPQMHSCFFWDLAGFSLARISGILIISCQKKNATYCMVSLFVVIFRHEDLNGDSVTSVGRRREVALKNVAMYINHCLVMLIQE